MNEQTLVSARLAIAVARLDELQDALSNILESTDTDIPADLRDAGVSACERANDWRAATPALTQ